MPYLDGKTLVGSKRSLEMRGNDFYPTPVHTALAMLRYIQFAGSIREPACGGGTIAYAWYLWEKNFNIAIPSKPTIEWIKPYNTKDTT